jgi:hypothetical protein
MEIDNPFGMENSDSEHSFWVAKAYTEIHILSRTATTAVISAEFKIQGASDENAQQRIRVATGAGFAEERVISDGLHSFAVPLQPGLNRILLRSMEKAPLLIRATRFSVSTPIQADRPQIRDLENTNGLERDGTDPFFWVGGHDTILTISAPSPGVAELQADVSPGPSLVDRSKARLWIVSQSGIKTEQDLDWGSAKIEIPVRAGANRVILRAIGPSVKVPTDARTMMIGIRNLRTSPLEETLRSK